ncbi:MAG: exodeoxyribonuclease VII large subunit [bacterium]|nr:exodeoxyribonuclease VII large subunit [bacterium]
MSEKYYTISALNAYIKAKFENDPALARILLQAEISNFKRHSSGHLYFSLKDEKSQISAIMFSSSANKLSFSPKDGDKVLIEGRISVYETVGNYQVYVNKMNLDGIGELYQKYEQLKVKLFEAGWFNESRKKPIPSFPQSIGIITSPTGAAIRDMIQIISRRYPLTRVYVYPAIVQGIEAKFSIRDQILKANKDALVDVLLVGRGGGSIEDLWAFNEEIVLKAILDSNIPIISAVGHETDTTLADYVADLRAPTPSGAAELSVPDQKDLVITLQSKLSQLHSLAKRHLQQELRHLQKVTSSSIFLDPNRMLERKYLTFDHLVERLEQAKPTHLLEKNKDRLQHVQEILRFNYYRNLQSYGEKYRQFITILDATSPLKVLKQGYGLIEKQGQVQSNIQKLHTNDVIQIRLSDGSIDASILSIRKEE